MHLNYTYRNGGMVEQNQKVSLLMNWNHAIRDFRQIMEHNEIFNLSDTITNYAGHLFLYQTHSNGKLKNSEVVLS